MIARRPGLVRITLLHGIRMNVGPYGRFLPLGSVRSPADRRWGGIDPLRSAGPCQMNGRSGASDSPLTPIHSSETVALSPHAVCLSAKAAAWLLPTHVSGFLTPPGICDGAL